MVWAASRRIEEGCDLCGEEISQDQRICTQTQTRVLAEQLTRADVPPRNAPRSVARGFSDGTLGRSVQPCMRRHAGPDAVASDVGCIKTCGGGSILENRRDRVTSMAAWKLKRLTTELRRAGSGGRFMCSGMRCMFGCSIRTPASCCASIWARSVAAIASAMRTVRGARRNTRINCWRGRTKPEPASARSATPSINVRTRREGATPAERIQP